VETYTNKKLGEERAVSTKEETLKEFKKHLNKLNEIDAIHPTQYYLANRSMRLAGGEKKLMLAILKDAIKCYRRNLAGKSVHSKKIFTETEEWFIDDDTTYLYSFRNICAWLGVDFKLIREKLIEMKDVPIQVSV
jgi:hypothetical protein